MATRLEAKINEDVARIRNVALLLLDNNLTNGNRYNPELLQIAYNIVADANFQEEIYLN